MHHRKQPRPIPRLNKPSILLSTHARVCQEKFYCCFYAPQETTTTRCGSLRRAAAPYDALRLPTTRCGSPRRAAAPYDALRLPTTRCGSPRRAAAPYDALRLNKPSILLSTHARVCQEKFYCCFYAPQETTIDFLLYSDYSGKVNTMLTISRVRTLLGFVAWNVYSEDYLLCTFFRYMDAVDFVLIMQDIKFS
jgi:hypothetical protein